MTNADPSPPPPADAAAYSSGAAMVAVATIGFGMIPILAVWTFSFGLSPAAAGLWRYLVPALLLSPVLVHTARLRRETGVLFASGMLVGLGTAFYFEALRSVPVSTAAVVYYTYPVWTLIIGRALFAQELGPRRIAAVVMVLAGSVVALGPAGLPRDAVPKLALALMSPITFGFLLNTLAVYGRGMSPVGQTAIVTAGCSLALLPLALADPATLAPASATGWAAVLTIGIVGMMLPAILFTAGIGRIGATAAGVISALELPVAMAAGALILGEAITPARAAGAALIVAAAVLASVSRRRQPPGAPR